MAVTAKMIAAKLHISPSAVSLALNGKPGVSEDTRERVLAEAAKLGYSQKKIVTETPQNIRFVIFLSNHEEVIQETSFYSYILQGLEKYAKRLGYNVLVSYYRIDEDPAQQIKAISADIMGMVILGTELNRSYLNRLKQLFELKIPMVMVDNYIEELDIDCIVTDNLRGVYHAAKYLLNKGYIRLGYLRSKVRIDNFAMRQEGFYKACNEAHLMQEPVIIDVGISSQRAFEDMCQWLDAGNIPPRAFIAENDVIAAACTRALKAHGYRIPRDVAMLSFDNMPICTMVEPPLTAIDVNKELIGKMAMNILHNRIHAFYCGAETNDDGTLLTYISTKLIEREST